MSSAITGSFRKNLSVVTVASFCSFGISLALSPVMTRWYRPVDYGTFAVINNLATLIATAFLLSLPNALPLTLVRHRRNQLLRSLLHLAVSAFLFAVVAVVMFFVTKLLNVETVSSDWVYMTMPLLVFAIALHRISQSDAVAEGAFRATASARVVHPLVAKPGAILSSMLSTAHPFYLVLFEVVGYFSQVVMMGKGRLGTILRPARAFKKRSFAVTAGVIRRHSDFSIYLNFINLLYLGAITFQAMILAHNYSVSETGWYSLAISMTSLPVQLVALASAPVIYHQFIRIQRDEPQALFDKTLKILLFFCLFGGFPYLLVFFYGPALFGYVFGRPWLESGVVAAIMTAPLYLQFLSQPIVSAFRVTSTLKFQFYIDCLFVIPTIVLFYTLTEALPFFAAIKYLAMALSLHQLVMIGFCLYVTRQTSKLAGPKRGGA